jgi:hypothetical protein
MDDEMARWTEKALRRLFRWEPGYNRPVPGEGVFTMGSPSWRTMRFHGHGLDLYRREFHTNDLPADLYPLIETPESRYALCVYQFRVEHPEFLIETWIEPEWVWRPHPTEDWSQRERLATLLTRRFAFAGDFRVARSHLGYLILLLEPSKAG